MPQVLCPVMVAKSREKGDFSCTGCLRMHMQGCVYTIKCEEWPLSFSSSKHILSNAGNKENDNFSRDV